MSYVKITDLIKSLEEVMEEHGDLALFVSQDEEGNGFSPLSPAYSHGYFHTKWYEFHDDGYYGDSESAKEEWQEYIEDENTVEGICLWP